MLQKEKPSASEIETISSNIYKDIYANAFAPAPNAPNVLLEEILLEMHALKEEVLKLREETSRNRQMILALEKRNESYYGDEIRKRIGSMLRLIEDYGGAMTSTSVKRLMGLSKDEFYRTLKCGKDGNLIEIKPNPKDRRGYIISIKPGN